MTTNLAQVPDPEDTDTTDFLTKEMLQHAVPDKRFRKHVTDKVLDLVNAEQDSELRRMFRDNTLSYASALMGGKYSVTAYVNAVKFVSYKLMGDTSSVAYGKVFPDRLQRLVNKNATASYIASFADNYSKNDLITKIMEQTMVPTHILNADIYQKAINKNAWLMQNARSEMVQQRAADSLMEKLAPPVAAKVEIDITQNNDILDELKATTRALARQQLSQIANGHSSVEEVAHSDIITVKAVDSEGEETELPDGQ